MHSIQGQAMGMTYRLVWNSPSAIEARADLQSSIDAELERLNSLFSLYRDDSTLARWNANPSTEWQETAPEIVELLEFAKVLHHESNGLFDPTIAPLMRLWRVNSLDLNWAPPTKAEVLDAQAIIGMEKVEWRRSPPALRKSIPTIELDLNALVEGLALRRLRHILSNGNIDHFLLELGGEFTSSANGEIASFWQIAIEQPIHSNNQHRHDAQTNFLAASISIALTNESLSTSGTYRGRRTHGERSYSHLINPKTGEPIDSPMLSASVVAADPLVADGWATTLMLLSPEQAIAAAERNKLAVCLASKSLEQPTLRSQAFDSRAQDDVRWLRSTAGLARFKPIDSLGSEGQIPFVPQTSRSNASIYVWITFQSIFVATVVFLLLIKMVRHIRPE